MFIINRSVLDLYDKYEGDFGLLDEPWASEEDRKKLTNEQMMLFSEYVEMLHFIRMDTVSNELKERALVRLDELERVVDPSVIKILRGRILGE